MPLAKRPPLGYSSQSLSRSTIMTLARYVDTGNLPEENIAASAASGFAAQHAELHLGERTFATTAAEILGDK